MTPPRPQTTVTVVVDCCFGGRLAELASSGNPLWVLDTADNRFFLEDLRSPGEPPRAQGGVTTFKASSKASPEQAFIGILQAVDMHHNELAAEPPYSAVEVFGAQATEAVRDALREFNLTVVEETASHFRAEASR